MRFNKHVVLTMQYDPKDLVNYWVNDDDVKEALHIRKVIIHLK